MATTRPTILWDAPGSQALRQALVIQLLDTLCITDDALPVHRRAPAS